MNTSSSIPARLFSRPAAVLLTVVSLGLTACAQNPPPPASTDNMQATPAPLRVGDATRQLLTLQRNATGPDRPIPGEQASLSYRRYLDTFKHPIPERTGSNISSGSVDKAQ
jgi:hypothetical protein